MARPRVFVSSTYYDLKHLRSSLYLFIESLGFEPVLSERGDIPYTPDTTLVESCYREAASTDILVLVVGGRYGAEASGKAKVPSRSFFERYESVTKKEYESAIDRDIPVYVLIESNVYSEYQTYLRNERSTSIKYAHVDSANVFRLIGEILAKPRNNPTHPFEEFSDIEKWLREQWAGVFRELLQRQSQQRQLSALGAQVSELKATNETLRKYLEAVMKGITPDASENLIKSEQRRLKGIEQLTENDWTKFVTRRHDVPFDLYVDAMTKTRSFSDFFDRVGTRDGRFRLSMMDIPATLTHNEQARRDFNEVRKLLGVPPLGPVQGEFKEIERITGERIEISDVPESSRNAQDHTSVTDTGQSQRPHPARKKRG